jgi:hypothetical protein
MSSWAFIAILLGAALVWYVVSRSSREGFAKEFIDKSNDEKTEMTSHSSYRQETNSFKPTMAPPQPLDGIMTPFRVNMYNSYIPA